MARWWFNREAGPKSSGAIAREIVVGKPVISSRAPAVGLFTCVCERCGHEFKSLKHNRRFHSTGCGQLLSTEKNALASAPRLTFRPPRLRSEMADYIGWSTAAGIDAEVAEKEYFRMKKAACSFGKKTAVGVFEAEQQKQRRVTSFGKYSIDYLAPRRRSRKTTIVPALSVLLTEPLFKPSVSAAIELRDAKDSPFKKKKKK